VARELNRLGIGYLHVVEPRSRLAGSPRLRQNTSSSRDRGWRVHRGFGRSHRQLRRRRPRRLWSPLHLEPGSAGTAAAGPLNHYDRSTFYGGDARGYTDYPATEATVAA